MNVVNPFFHRSAIHYPDYFFGRQEVLTRIVNLLRTQHHVAVLGPQRIGKTSLLLHLLRLNQAQAGTDSTIWVYFDCRSWHHTTPQALWADMATALLEALCERSHADWQILVGDELPLQALQQLVEEIAAAGYRAVFLLDEFNTLQVSGSHTDEMLSGLQALALQGDVGYVTASTQPLQTGTVEGFSTSHLSFLKAFASVPLGLFNSIEAMGLLRSLSARSGHVFSSATVEWLMELAGPHPLYLQLVGSCAFEYLGRQGDLNTPAARLHVRQAFLDRVRPYWCHAWSLLTEEDRRVSDLLLFQQESNPAQTQHLEQAGLILREAHGTLPIRWLSREFQIFVSQQVAIELNPFLPMTLIS